VLFDPLEEQLDLPARLVERTDGACRQDELVGEKDERLGGFGILETDAAQMIGVMPLAVVAIESDGLVTDDPGAAIDGSRIDAMGVEIRLGAGYKEGAGLMQTWSRSKSRYPRSIT